MTDLTQPQINELTEILTGAPVTRVATKARAEQRFIDAAVSARADHDMILGQDFPTAKGLVFEAMNPESEMLKNAEAVTGKGIGGPGLARLRAHKDYNAITAQTQAEAAAAITGENPFDKNKKRPTNAAAAKAFAADGTVLDGFESREGKLIVIHQSDDGPVEKVVYDPDIAKEAEPAAPEKAKRSKFTPDALIKVIADNPKRPGTKAHAIFSCYGSGTKVSAFITCVKKAGYTEADARSNLAWDARKDFIVVTEASA